jgi:hypothetical protein
MVQGGTTAWTARPTTKLTDQNSVVRMRSKSGETQRRENIAVECSFAEEACRD